MASKTLAIDLSSECFNSSPLGKSWLDFRTFVRRYWRFLSGYTLLVSYKAERILLEIAGGIEKSTGLEVHFTIEPLGTSRATRSAIANCRQGEFERVLWFLDPLRLLEQLQTLPVRMMSDRGHKIHVNFGAALWAERSSKASGLHVQHLLEIHPGESVVLVEENGTAEMAGFIDQHCETLGLFPKIVTTNAMKNLLEYLMLESGSSANLCVTTLKDGGHGELMEIGNWIIRDYYNVPPLRMDPSGSPACHVIAFSHYQEEPGLEMQKFFEMCADPCLRLNLLVNQQTADEWIYQFKGPKHSFVAGAES